MKIDIMTYTHIGRMLWDWYVP